MKTASSCKINLGFFFLFFFFFVSRDTVDLDGKKMTHDLILSHVISLDFSLTNLIEGLNFNLLTIFLLELIPYMTLRYES